MKQIYIGEIVDSELDCYLEDDMCPSKFRESLKDIQKGEDIELNITSPGGSVFAGNAIISYMRELKNDGHHIVAKVHGIAASMGSVIACAADELIMDKSAVMMMHLPWSVAIGNQNDLRKEADTLELMTKTLISVYKTKFPAKSEKEIEKMLQQETWILATEAEEYGLVCTIDEEADEPVMMAASMRDKLSKYSKHIPTNLRGLIMKEEEVKNETDNEEVVVSQSETSQNETDETNDEEVAETVEDKVVSQSETTQSETDETTEMISIADCEKRVSGMQSSMAKQMDILKKDYEAKINDFNVQIEAKDKELTSYKNEIISLKDSLEKANGELQNMASALEEKTKALEMLNSSVNRRPDEEELFTLEEIQAKYKGNPKKIAELVKAGKYVK